MSNFAPCGPSICNKHILSEQTSYHTIITSLSKLSNIVSDPSCACGCPLEDAIHYLLECPLYTNARMQLFMSITPYTVISIENLLFGSDNLTDENNLIVFRNVQKYIHHSNRFE
jgi:hypothetical protein